MRKKFLSYVMMVIVTFVVGVNVVKAEDYTFSTKVYKVDVIDDNFITRYNNGEFQEVQSGGTLNAGDTIAVGVYVDVKNATSHGFDIRLNWDNSILEPIYNEDDESFDYDRRSIRRGGFYPSGWTVNIDSESSPYTTASIYNTDNTSLFDVNAAMYWLFYKVKDSVHDDVYLSFTFRRTSAFNNFGKEGVDVTNIPSVFKIKGNLAEPYTLMGDINGNGKIDLGDVLMMFRYVGRTLTFSEQERAVADVTGDGNINVLDQVKLFNMYVSN